MIRKEIRQLKREAIGVLWYRHGFTMQEIQQIIKGKLTTNEIRRILNEEAIKYKK